MPELVPDFIRPYFLWCLLPLVAAWLIARRRDTGRELANSHIAAHLISALQVGTSRGALRVCDLLFAALTLMTIAAAGPAWMRHADPDLSKGAPLVVILEVNEGMLAQDIAPNRLARAQQKILDLLKLRPDLRVGIVVHSASAHVLTPLTHDPAIVRPLLEALMPDVMPSPGEAMQSALGKARTLLADEPRTGSILIIADGLSEQNRAAIEGHLQAHPQALQILQMTDFASVSGLSAVAVSIDSGDVREISDHLSRIQAQQQRSDDALPLKDQAIALLWPAAALMLLWFSRAMAAPVMLALMLISFVPSPVQAQESQQGFIDLWLTEDQRGRWYYERGDYLRASEYFRSASWRGMALYKAGRYEQAASSFAEADDAASWFNRGTALFKAQRFTRAVQALEQAARRAPADARIAKNLALARAAEARVLQAREESGIGEHADMQADGFRQTEKVSGQETTVMNREDSLRVEAAEQWMRMVDTHISDFLRTRFGLEAAQESDQ